MVPEIWSVTDIIFVILDHFLHFYPPMDQDNQNFEKNKKTPGNIIILNRCNINHNHIWLLRYRAQQTEFFVILEHFLHFKPPKNPKNQNFEKLKKTLEISSFYKSVPKIMITCYTVP